jgi:predicted RNase H-like HicB family nuclease
MTTYTAWCEWDPAGWWTVTVPEVPGAITQSRRLDHVPGDVAEAIELMVGEATDGYRLEIERSVPN